MTSGPSFEPQVVLGRVLFRSGNLAVARRDVLAWAERFDPACIARMRRRAGLAALEDAVPDEEVEAAAAEYRYDRDLESADALIRWLADRGLTVDAWWEVMRRNVLERRLAGVEVEAPEEDDEEARLADAALSDVLISPAESLARRIAVARGTAAWAPPRESGLPAAFDGLEAIWRGWRDAQLTDQALQAAVDRERVAWLAFDMAETRWSSADAAREAISCVRHDGMSLEEVATAARAPLAASRRLLADVPDVLHDALLSAVAGDLVGPVEVPPHWILVQVRAKRTPALDEPLVRSAAERSVEAAAVAPLVAKHIAAEPGL